MVPCIIRAMSTMLAGGFIVVTSKACMEVAFVAFCKPLTQ